jgi:UDP-N-acetylmuramoyl-L-alanyl-D-glutamate--2,6-diaminopimelate ligase
MSAAMPLLPRGLTVGDLARELARVGARVSGDEGVSVSDVRQDSRRIEPGDLFVARGGARFDGNAFVEDAVRRGAMAALVASDAAVPSLSIPTIRVDDIRVAVGLAAEAVHGHPSRRLSVVGITGTNGKTTTAWLVQHALESAGAPTARLGTLGYSFRSDVVDESLTTPEADEVSRYAARAVARGASHLVMEVSSHALAQARVDALTFAVAAFTNLTQDHLDYHRSMEAYAEAKARLFTHLRPRASVVYVDDPFGEKLAAQSTGTVLTVGKGSACNVRAENVVLDASGIRANVHFPSGEAPLVSRLVGAHNLDNLLVTLGIVEALGLDVRRAAEGLSAVPPVPGRLERCDSPADDLTVLVDYAHTPDALTRVLAAVRRLGPGKVHCVFGCGGDRDPGKRPKMGAAVGAGADRATITNDNPRSEDPRLIADAIEGGLRLSGIVYDVELDRARAIEKAIVGAAAGDVILLAGKGHEPYQIIGSDKRAFDDRDEARRALEKRRRAR